MRYDTVGPSVWQAFRSEHGASAEKAALAYLAGQANQLVRVTVTNQWKAEFSYDGLGRRRIARDYSWSGASWTLTNEVRYVWDGMVVLQERDGANAVQVTYTRGLDLSGTRQGAGGIGGLLARTDASGTTFYHNDAGGKITAMADGNGNVVARYLYDPFGNLLAKSGAMVDDRCEFACANCFPMQGERTLVCCRRCFG